MGRAFPRRKTQWGAPEKETGGSGAGWEQMGKLSHTPGGSLGKTQRWTLGIGKLREHRETQRGGWLAVEGRGRGRGSNGLNFRGVRQVGDKAAVLGLPARPPALEPDKRPFFGEGRREKGALVPQAGQGKGRQLRAGQGVGCMSGFRMEGAGREEEEA